MDNKELKKIIKNEIAPLLIGIRNDITEKTKRPLINKVEGVLLKGKPGYTPIKDKDYPSETTVFNFIKDNLPKRGREYWTDKDIKDIVGQVLSLMPSKDELKGKDGDNAVIDYTLVKELATPLISAKYAQLKAYVDDITDRLLKAIDENKIPELSAETIRTKLESLKGNARLDAKAIKGLEKYMSTFIATSGGGGGGGTSTGGGSQNLQEVTDIGSTTTNNIDALSFNSVALTATGSSTKFLAEDGTYVPVPTSGTLTYVLSSSNSDIGGYESMPSLTDYTAAALASIVTAGVSTTPTLLGTFATDVGFPNVTVIPAGLFAAHWETEKTAGSNNYYCYYEVYKRTAGGTETLLSTSDITTQTAVNTRVQQTATALLTANTTVLSTDRMVIKIYGVMLSATATITLYYDDTTDARFEMPSATVDATNFVPYTGATIDVNLGTKTITTPTVIGGTSTTSDLILRTTSGVGTTGADMIFQGGNNGATEFARFLNSGDFGVGTASPSVRFQVNTTVTPSTTVIGQYIVNATSGNNAGTAIRLGYAANTGSTVGISGYYNASTESGMFMGFGVGATTYMTLSPTGRLGLGTIAPTRALHISDTINNYQIRTGSTGVFNYDMGRNGSTGLFYFYGNQTGAVGYVFDGANGEAMRIDTSRRLGIGTGTIIGSRLQVNTVSSSIIGLIVQGATSQTASLQQWHDSASSPVASVGAGGEFTAASVTSNGNVAGVSGSFNDSISISTYLASGGLGLDTLNGTVGVQLAGPGYAGNFYDISNSLYVCDGTYAVNATGTSYLNGPIQTPAMPTADPADGQGTLWYDSMTNQVYRGT